MFSLRILTAALCVCGVASARLRRVNATANATASAGAVAKVEEKSLPGDPDVHDDWDYAPFEDPDVTEKYTGAESVSETLFVLACKAKHKNDIDGKARDKAKEEKFTEKEFAAYVKKLQDTNLATMKEACGHTNNKASIACRKHCTDNWASGGAASLPLKKQKCLDMCTKKHDNWEAECMDQVDNLQQVFISEQGNLANTKKCQQIHCKDFPAVLMMKEDEAKDAKKEGCKDLCTDKQIKAKCVKRWGLSADTASAAYQDECREETTEGTLDPCKDDSQKKSDDDAKKCKDDGKKKCDDEHKKCMDDAKAGGDDTMIGANADSICGVRKDVCNTQSTEKCMDEFKESLDKGMKKCMKEFKEESKKCFDDKLEAGEKEFKDKCFDDIKPTCKEDCEDRCQIRDMNDCKEDMIKKAFGVTAKFCKQLWRWTFDSEQIDMKTGDPIPKEIGGGRFKNIKRLGDKGGK